MLRELVGNSGMGGAESYAPAGDLKSEPDAYRCERPIKLLVR